MSTTYQVGNTLLDAASMARFTASISDPVGHHNATDWAAQHMILTASDESNVAHVQEDFGRVAQEDMG